MHAHIINTMALSCLANLLGLSLLLIGAHNQALGALPPQPQQIRPAPPPQRPLPPRKKVVVQGIVECVYCVIKKGRPGSLSKTVLLPGAVVKLQCNNTKRGWEEDATTDKSGSFTFRPEGKVSTWGAHQCKVILVSSPRHDCPIIDNYYFIDSRRAFLTPAPTNTTSPFQLFTVGPLWFEPATYICP